MNGLLLQGDIDFAFVDSFALDTQINLTPVGMKPGAMYVTRI